MDRPDVLVLAAGGVLGEAWMTGVLAGIEDAGEIDMTAARAFVGTSAGSIVAARLASGRHPRRPADPLADGEIDQAVADPTPALLGVLAPFAATALALRTRPASYARTLAFRVAPKGTRSMAGLRDRVGHWQATFDGRLHVCALDTTTGRRTVFGAPGAPPATVPDAVMASCAIPATFEPIVIGGREYVDGGAWSLTNLDAAPIRRGDRVLCLDPAANPRVPRLSPMGAIRTAAAALTALEIAAVTRRGAGVEHVGPDGEAARLMAPSLMDPGPVAQVLAAGHRQGRAISARPSPRR